MRLFNILLTLSLCTFAIISMLNGAAKDLKPTFLKQGKLLIDLNFDDGKYDQNVTVPKEESRWTVKDKQLYGTPSTKEHQAAKESHNGKSPIVGITLPTPKVIVKFDFLMETPKSIGKAYIAFAYPSITMGFWDNEKAKSRLSSGTSTDINEGNTLEVNKWYSFIAEVYEEEVCVTVPGLRTYYIKNVGALKFKAKPELKFHGYEKANMKIDNIQIYEAAGIQDDWSKRQPKVLAATTQEERKAKPTKEEKKLLRAKKKKKK